MQHWRLLRYTRYYLKLKETVLEDEETFLHYGIQDGSVISLCISFEGDQEHPTPQLGAHDIVHESKEEEDQDLEYTFVQDVIHEQG